MMLTLPRRLLSPLIWLAACGGPGDPSQEPAPATTPDPTAPDDTGTAPDTTPTSDTGEPEPTPEPDLCDQPASFPATYTTHAWAPAAEDFVISDAGDWISIVGGNLSATQWGGSRQIIVPNLGDVRGTRILPDGRYVLAQIETGSILLVSANGSVEVLAGGLSNPNGIAVGDDGLAYVTAGSQIVSVDPDNGAVAVVASLRGRSFDGIAWSPDYQRLYFNEELGRVHWVDRQPDGSFGPVQDGPQLPLGPFSILDGMTTDACGNLYIAEMGSNVWRITANGQVDLVVRIAGASVLPALNFGPGRGGFDRDVLYVQDFLGKMHAVDIGLPGKLEPHWSR